MAWNRTKMPCCRYANCPNTLDVPGRGLVTSAPELEKGFCDTCHEHLYGGRDPRTTKHKRLRRPDDPLSDGDWSRAFVCCVEPTCPKTTGMETSIRHGGVGFCVYCYTLLAAPPKICAFCGNVRPVMRRTERGPECRACFQLRRYHEGYRPPADVCAHCGEESPVYDRLKNGAPICKKCYQDPIEVCSSCGEEKAVEARGENDEPFCPACYRNELAPKARCDECGTKAAVAMWKGNRAICRDCYERPVEKCWICGEERSTHARTGDGRPICSKCYVAVRLPERCSECHELGLVWQRDEDGRPICSRCYQRPLAVCSRCNRRLPRKRRTKTGFLCGGCDASLRYQAGLK